MSHQVGRNDLCPCGSGKKAKNCHGTDFGTGGTNRNMWILGGVIGLAAIAAIIVFGGDSNPPLQAGPSRPMTPATTSTTPMTTGQSQAASGPGTPQPPGPAPAGKVWSTEHGHWHDAPGTQVNPAQNVQLGNQTPGRTQAMTPQPPGPAPAGKVWSPEHGHWHDAPNVQVTQTPGQTPPQPAQQAPATPAGTGP